jgi:hypothetical protein
MGQQQYTFVFPSTNRVCANDVEEAATAAAQCWTQLVLTHMLRQAHGWAASCVLHMPIACAQTLAVLPGTRMNASSGLQK